MNNRQVLKYIRSDVYRYRGNASTGTLLKCFLLNPNLRFQMAFRCCKGKGVVRLFGRLLYGFSRTKRRIVLPRQTQVGYGLYIGHGGPIVISPSAVIGNNVNLSQFTTIGSNHDKAATIGDCTYIGPNVCIVEDVVIGRNVTIGAGAVVTKDIPDDATAVGNYARVINYNDPGRYTKNNRWMDTADD